MKPRYEMMKEMVKMQGNMEMPSTRIEPSAFLKSQKRATSKR
jgi:hypothetical protein